MIFVYIQGKAGSGCVVLLHHEHLYVVFSHSKMSGSDIFHVVEGALVCVYVIFFFC